MLFNLENIDQKFHFRHIILYEIRKEISVTPAVKHICNVLVKVYFQNLHARNGFQGYERQILAFQINLVQDDFLTLIRTPYKRV